MRSWGGVLQKIPSGHPKVYGFFNGGIHCLHAAASGFCLAQYPRPACTALLNATTFLGLYMPWQKMVRRGRLGHVGVTIAKLRHVPDDHLQSQASRYTLSVSVASSRSQSAPIAPLQIYIPGTALAEEVS